ncbi:MAG TPA: 3-oxoacyl-ACP reductase FabG [Bacillota bacterium]|nr:3-oxoacyl-ACP reductase FabG [Bacillota bacterium]
MRLKDQIAMITGGGSGLGKESSLLFAQEGATVVIVDVNQKSGEDTVEEIQKSGGKACFRKFDVGNHQEVQNQVQEIYDQFGSIDVLINNAGITRDALIHKMTYDQWEQLLRINLSGVFNCTNAVVPIMREKGYGRIISTSSVVGLYGNIGQTNYAAAKAGVIGMTKTWAKELGPKGITVNAVAPGFIRTPMTDAVPEKILKMMEEKVPVRRLGEPRDIANAYLFLALPESSYINGSILSVDGGLVL